MKKILINGAAGFLGSHIEYRLKAEGHFVVSVARKQPPYRKSVADELNILDLTNPFDLHHHYFRHHFDEVWQLAGDVGGLGHIGTGLHDADILTNSLKINLHTLEAIRRNPVGKIFFASSACVYPDLYYAPAEVEWDLLDHAYLRSSDGRTPEAAAYPANPTNEFGWEKLFSERLYTAYSKAYGIDIRIGRLGNTYGPYCTWDGDRAKVVAAICRKVAQASYAQPIEIWGDGNQTRSFTYVDDAIEGMIRLMASRYDKPLNIAFDKIVTINHLVDTVGRIANKVVGIVHTDGPVGARGRTSDNTLIRQVLDWEPTTPLWDGLKITYPWIAGQVLTKTPA